MENLENDVHCGTFKENTILIGEIFIRFILFQPVFFVIRFLLYRNHH